MYKWRLFVIHLLILNHLTLIFVLHTLKVNYLNNRLHLLYPFSAALTPSLPSTNLLSLTVSLSISTYLCVVHLIASVPLIHHRYFLNVCKHSPCITFIFSFLYFNSGYEIGVMFAVISKQGIQFSVHISIFLSLSSFLSYASLFIRSFCCCCCSFYDARRLNHCHQNKLFAVVFYVYISQILIVRMHQSSLATLIQCNENQLSFGSNNFLSAPLSLARSLLLSNCWLLFLCAICIFFLCLFLCTHRCFYFARALAHTQVTFRLLWTLHCPFFMWFLQ